MDFAFFAVNFGYSRADYDSLTPTEKMLILKAYENRVVTDTTLLAAAVANAVGNVFRKKGKRPQKLWKKRPRKGNVQQARENRRIVQLIEAKEGKGWVDEIYRAAGRKRKKRGDDNEGT